MTGFWEQAFQNNREMWGMEPAKSALVTRDLFAASGAKSILIPGVGYGRNAKVFIDSAMAVTGIEISQTAVDLAKKHFSDKLTIYHGPVTDMPFDDKKYDGIFCYALLHLLDKSERSKLIRDCFAHLHENGLMVFTTVTKDAEIFGRGVSIGKDRFEMFGGVKMFFYDENTIKEEFADAGLFETTVVTENYPFYLIKCKKNGAGELPGKKDR